MKKLIPFLISSLFATSALALDPFVVKDIRVEGIQRTEAGTVFSYLPVKVGETLDDEKAAAAIKALYATGFFKDVRLEAENGVLVVTVQERPAIAQVDISRRQGIRQGTAQGWPESGRSGRIEDFRQVAAGPRRTGTEAAIFQPRQICGHHHHHRDAAGAQPRGDQLRYFRRRGCQDPANQHRRQRRHSRKRICSTCSCCPRRAG